jgi:hypothetical protein
MPREYHSNCIIREAQLDDLPAVLDNLVEAGKKDMCRAGINPAIQLYKDYKTYNTYLALTPDQQPMVLFGINNEGNVWMQMTNEVYKHPRFFIQATKTWLQEQKSQILFNYIDIQNTALLKMVKKLGFKFLRVIPMTKNNNYYVEFVRL